jgi:hypothetical protein
VIRAMTIPEIRKALRHSAEVCIRDGRICWASIDVCIADATADAAQEYAGDADAAWADTPSQAANFLLLVAEALTC